MCHRRPATSPTSNTIVYSPFALFSNEDSVVCGILKPVSGPTPAFKGSKSATLGTSGFLQPAAGTQRYCSESSGSQAYPQVPGLVLGPGTAGNCWAPTPPPGNPQTLRTRLYSITVLTNHTTFCMFAMLCYQLRDTELPPFPQNINETK